MSDLISRQAAKSKAVYSYERHEKVVPVAELDWLPSVEPERKPGKWIGEERWCLPKCSVCGASCFGEHGFDAIKTPYCPTCGAEMEVDNGLDK